MSSKFLNLRDVIALHDEQIELFGGLPGIRDLTLLESAVEQPRLFIFGELLHPDIPSQAAAYLFHIAMNHAFIDGNKRTALAAALTFLRGNNRTEVISNSEAFELTLGVANGSIDKEQLTNFLRTPPIQSSDPIPNWIEVGITAINQGIKAEDVPEIKGLAEGLMEAFIRSGIMLIEKRDQVPAAYIDYQRGGIVEEGFNIYAMTITDHLSIAHLVGMSEMEVRQLYTEPFEKRAKRWIPYLEKTFLIIGLQRLALRSSSSYIGWKSISKELPDFAIRDVGQMPFLPHVLEELREEALKAGKYP